MGLFGGGIGSLLGAAVGSFIPGVGTALGAQIGGGIGGMIGGGGTRGTNPSATTNSSALPQIPDYMSNDYYNTLYPAARNLYNTPFQPYTGQAVAPFSQDQLNAFQGVRNLQGQYQPLMNSASGLAMMAGNQYQGGISQPELDQFMNPYQQGVIDIAKRNAMTDYDTQLAQMKAKAAGSGTFGGSREALMESTLQNNTLRNINDLQLQGSAQNFNQAMANVMANRQGLLNSASGLAMLAGQGQTYGYKDIGALSAQGDQQQQLQQAQDQFNLSEFQRQLAYPQTQFNNYNNFLQSMMGKTTNQVQVQNPGSPSALATGLGIGSILNSGVFNNNNNSNNSNSWLGSNGGLSNFVGSWGSAPYSTPGGGTGYGSGLLGGIHSLFSGLKDGGLVRGYKDGGLVEYLKNVANKYESSGGAAGSFIDLSNAANRGADYVMSKIPDYVKEHPIKTGAALGLLPLGAAAGLATKALPYIAAGGEAMYGGLTGLLTASPALTQLAGAAAIATPWDKVLAKNNNTAVASLNNLAPSDEGKTPSGPMSLPIAYDSTTGTATSPSDNSSSVNIPEVNPKMDYNEPLFKFGAALLNTPGSFVHGLGAAANAYSDAKDTDFGRQFEIQKLNQEVGLKKDELNINRQKAASESALQMAQANVLNSQEKERLQQQQLQAKFDMGRIDLAQKNFKQASDNGDEIGMKYWGAQQVVESNPDNKNIVLNGMRTGALSKEDVNKLNITPDFIRKLMDGGYLTKDDTVSIIKKYFK